MNSGVFRQIIPIPLRQSLRILTRVAGYHTEVISFLPPPIATPEHINCFLAAMRQVLTDPQRVPEAAWETVLGLATGEVRS